MSKILPHRKSDPPTSASTSRPRVTPCQGPEPLKNGRKSRLGVSRLAGAWTNTPTARFTLTQGRGAATGQRPRRQRLNPVARLRCRGRLGAGDGPTWRGRWRGVGARAARR